MPFISFCFLTAEARTFSTMLNNSESGHPCRVPDLKGKALSFFPVENDICCGLFIDGSYDIEKCPLYPYILKGFNQERMLYFVKCFFCINCEDHMVLDSFLGDVTYHTDEFANVEPPLHPRDESHLVMTDNPFNVLLDPIG